MATQFKFSRRGGYECSSKGDKRFSAFCARLADGRTIEEHYQCDVKGYQPGGTNWRLGKGRAPLDQTKDLWAEYLALWEEWADAHPDLMDELGYAGAANGYVLSDCFASTPVNQARALAELLNKHWTDDAHPLAKSKLVSQVAREMGITLVHIPLAEVKPREVISFPAAGPDVGDGDNGPPWY